MKKIISMFLVLTLIFGMCCTAFAASDPSELKTYTSKNLENFSTYFDTFVLLLASVSEEPIDVVATTGKISYDENSFNYGDSGIGVISGGAYSKNGTVTMGMGTGIDENEDYWYVSLTFSPEASSDTVLANSLAFILAASETDIEAEDFEEELEAAAMIADFLFASEEPVAFESDGQVLLHKLLSGGTHLLALDSVEYYDEFYYNDIENYIVAD